MGNEYKGKEKTYVQSLNPFIEARLDALGHQAAAAVAAEVVLDAAFAEAVFLWMAGWGLRESLSPEVYLYVTVVRHEELKIRRGICG